MFRNKYIEHVQFLNMTHIKLQPSTTCRSTFCFYNLPQTWFRARRQRLDTFLGNSNPSQLTNGCKIAANKKEGAWSWKSFWGAVVDLVVMDNTTGNRDGIRIKKKTKKRKREEKSQKLLFDFFKILILEIHFLIWEMLLSNWDKTVSERRFVILILTCFAYDVAVVISWH